MEAATVRDPSHNLINLLDAHAARQADRPALIYPRLAGAGGHIDYETLTYGALAARVDRLAWSLRERGVEPGDRVVVMVPMSLDLYTLLLALFKLAAVAVFIDPWVGLAQLDRCCALVAPKAFVGALPAHALRLASPAFRAIPLHLVAGGLAGAIPRLVARGAGGVPVTPVCPDDTALVTFTTGSSGQPKGANRTHRYLLAQHAALKRELGTRETDVDMPAFPILLLHNLAAGIPSVIPLMKPSKPARVRPERIVRQVRDHGVTTMSGSPAYFMPLAHYCLREGIALPGVRAIFTGGAPTPTSVLQPLSQILPKGEVHVLYGSTEAEPVASIGAWEAIMAADPRRGTPVGLLAFHTNAKIIRCHDGPVALGALGWAEWEVPLGEVGEIVVTGDHVCKDYYHNPEAVAAIKIRAPDGTIWHRMGDTGAFDINGRLWLVGRLHTRIVRAGRTYHPIIAEGLAMMLPWVARAACVGIPDPTRGQRTVLVLVHVDRPWWLPPAQAAAYAREAVASLAAHDIPVDHVVFRRSLPVDPRHNAKIDYAVLQRRYRGLPLQPVPEADAAGGRVGDPLG